MNILLRSILIAAILIVASDQTINAQEGSGGKASQVELRGRVLDAATDKPLEYANVAVYSLPDSSLANGGITNAKGNFSLFVGPGNYFVQIQFISYQIKTIPAVTVDAGINDLNLGITKMALDVETLEEVVVQAERDQVEMKLDKRVVNVGKDASNAGRNAADILDNVPSVSVDQEGNVSLRGSENVRILIDGKPSGLIGISSSDGLRQLQGDVIESIEVVTNPSARYDAEGNAGIINIILKKDRKKGLNGSINLNTGYPDNHGASVNFNFRREKVNFFVNYNIQYRRRPGEGSNLQLFNLSDSSYISDQSTDFERGGLSNSVRTGFEYFLTNRNTITASFLYRNSNDQNERSTRFRDFDGSNQLFQESVRDEEEDEDDINYQYDLSYRRTFKNKRQLLTADIQYRDNSEVELADITENTLFTLADFVIDDNPQNSDNQELEESWLVQADYVHPIGLKGKFETGYRGNFRKLANNYLVQTLVDGQLINDTNLSNNFRYTENVNAAYAIYGDELNKFSYLLGLRLEATDIEINLLQTDERFSKQYTDLFPSAFLTYKIAQGNSIQASYSRRIRRPRSRNLNPFPFSINDNRNLRTGNPDLDPTYTDSYEIGYLKTWKKSSLYSSFYYRQTKGVVQRITRRVDTVNISSPVNLSTENAYGFEFNYNYDITDWWKINDLPIKISTTI
ncbi:MAG: TonB-dependent receptor, partial [Bacteroidota bacterium]